MFPSKVKSRHNSFLGKRQFHRIEKGSQKMLFFSYFSFSQYSEINKNDGFHRKKTKK